MPGARNPHDCGEHGDESSIDVGEIQDVSSHRSDTGILGMLGSENSSNRSNSLNNSGKTDETPAQSASPPNDMSLDSSHLSENNDRPYIQSRFAKNPFMDEQQTWGMGYPDRSAPAARGPYENDRATDPAPPVRTSKENNPTDSPDNIEGDDDDYDDLDVVGGVPEGMAEDPASPYREERGFIDVGGAVGNGEQGRAVVSVRAATEMVHAGGDMGDGHRGGARRDGCQVSLLGDFKFTADVS